ncbi:MAG TPA: hypothetical protein VL361_30225 [Candidatus Limnocylindrales bacterium]|nr:hypothetical protein [Candidatus Limnocylindrales bacterium]
MSALWRVGSNWSAGQPPSTSFDPTTIATSGTKTITVDSSTPAANLGIQGLTLSAPFGSTNTLLLDNLPSGSRFTTSRGVSIGSGGLLRITNSTFQASSTFDINGGNLTIDSGLLDTSPNLVDLRLGRASGSTATATVNGGTIKCFGLKIGDLANSPGAVTLNGGTILANSVVDMGEVLNSPGSLTILAGQLIATNDITRVGNLGSGQFTQSGGFSLLAFWSIADNAPGTATISGGQVTVTPASALDVTRVGNFGTGHLNITGGTVWLRSDLHVADNPGVVGNVLVTGGLLIATNDLVAIGRYGIGDMTITNATAYFTNTSIGRHTDSIGTLNLQTGAALFCYDDISIGRFTNATGHLNISGGLLSVTNDNIWCGREGIGDLTVSGGTVLARALFVGMSEDSRNAPQGSALFMGGVTTLSSNLVVGTSLLSTGQVQVLGGILSVTNSTGGNAVVVISGGFSQNGGTLIVDQLVVTNQAGSFSFTSGTLQARNLTIANGTPFVVGDGTNPATLQLDGGTYSFADGLVIRSNATVTGCGVILGNIVNSGTLSTNCGGGVTISSLAKEATTATMSFSTLKGATHVLEFTDTLTATSWTPLLPGVIGDGNLMTIQDINATNSSRFYRIHVQ